MPIESPRLDDLTFDRTVEELVRRIPVYAPEWTDHNVSDPGISLIHLFAHLAEQVGYRLNRIPEKNHIELLKLLGVRLQPAHAAATRLALLLRTPSTFIGTVLAAGAKALADKGDPPPTFETTEEISIVPAEPVLVVTTKNPFIHDVLLREDGTRETPSTFPSVPNNDTEWLSVAWDGKTPKPKDMPTDPVALFKRPGQSYVWVAIDYNHALNAGFRNARVSLSIQLDDDEQPAVSARVLCETPRPAGEAAPQVDWLHYWNAAGARLERVPGRSEDTTNQLARSGIVTFTVPLDLGPIANWIDLRPATAVTPMAACLEMANTMRTKFAGVSAAALGFTDPDDFDANVFSQQYRTVLDAGVVAARDAAAAAQPPIAHPLDPALRARAKAWLRITVPPRAADAKSPRIRIVSFNTVPAIHATTVLNELVGRADGRPGQRYSFAHRDVLAGSVVLEMQEDSLATTPLVRWEEVESLDGRGPFESAYELDREAGSVIFGDGADENRRLGRGGRIPPLVPNGGEIIARRYQYGGGLAGNVPAGSIKTLETAVAGSPEVVNYVAAAGGRNAETLEEAKRRARKELSTRSRAVTAGDFEWIARQTPTVRVARAHIVPLRRPLAASASAAVPPVNPRCGPALPTGPLGLSSGNAPGAVTIVVVPDEPGPEPLPTPSFLRAVCRHLDDYRLVTTEVHITAPQYCRVCNVLIRVRARAGYTRARLQQSIEERLGTYLHVLRGGEDGKGFPFGAQVHVADLIAQVFRTEGVERVEDLSAEFTRTKSDASPREGQLVLCPTTPGQADRVALGPEENVSIDVTSIAVSTVA